MLFGQKSNRVTATLVFGALCHLFRFLTTRNFVPTFDDWENNREQESWVSNGRRMNEFLTSALAPIADTSVVSALSRKRTLGTLKNIARN